MFLTARTFGCKGGLPSRLFFNIVDLLKSSGCFSFLGARGTVFVIFEGAGLEISKLTFFAGLLFGCSRNLNVLLFGEFSGISTPESLPDLTTKSANEIVGVGRGLLPWL